MARLSGLPKKAVVASFLTLIGAFFLGFFTSSTTAAEAVRWRTGAEFQRQLKAGVGISWSGNPLRNALNSLSKSQRVAIFLDRRVDPDLKVEFSASDVPLDLLLERLAEQLKLNVFQLGNVIYIGPPMAVMKLATVSTMRREEVRDLPDLPRSRVVISQQSSWEMLSTPQEILQRAADDAGIRFVSLDRVPHDLWPAADLPSLSFADRFSLLLIGFDMTFEWAKDGSAVRPIPLADIKRVKRTYRIQGDTRRIVDGLRKKLNDVEMRPDGRNLLVTGSFADHFAISRLLKGEPVRRPVAEKNLKRLKIEKLDFTNQQVGGVIQALAKRLNLELKIEPDLLPKLQKRTSLKVENVTYEEVFRAVLEPVGLTFELSGKQLILRSKKN